MHPDVWLEGYEPTFTEALMTGTDRHWLAILSLKSLEKQKDPHPTTACAIIDGTTYWSSVLPLRTCGNETPWVGSTHSDKMAAVLSELEPVGPERPGRRLVWGGDWNQALVGKDYAGSTEGRKHLLNSIDRLALHVPTAGLRSQLLDHASIDHTALPQSDFVSRVERIPAKTQTATLSDHDAYIVDVDAMAPLGR